MEYFPCLMCRAFLPLNLLNTVKPGRKFLLICLILHTQVGYAQSKTDEFLKELLESNASPLLKNILAKPDSFRYQIIYTQINRDKKGTAQFRNYYFRFDPEEYFNPASTVKMPLAFLALEKANELKKYGVDKYSAMLTDSSYAGQTRAWADSSAEDGLPAIAQYIRKIFLVSDNDAYNRLYEFIGQERINRRLHEMGYSDVRITRRFVPMNEDQNRHTNAIRFLDKNKLLYEQAPAYNQQSFQFGKQVLIGRAHYDSKDSLINTPMDFTRHNNISLEDLQYILWSVLFPETVLPTQRFGLNADDYRFLYQYLSEYPSESRYPHYDSVEYFDSYTKYIMFRAGKSPIPRYIRIFNKPGWSYGFLTDIAYIVDFSKKIEFMLSAVIYVNSDGILNDDKYDYEDIGYPYFKEIGDIIYRYELKRPRKQVPDLQRFMLKYH